MYVFAAGAGADFEASGNSELLAQLLAKEEDRAAEVSARVEDLRERDAYVREAGVEAARVPVSEERSAKSGGAPGAHVSLVVMGCARLPFPYTADACECANEIVLSRVRELVASVQ